jgi:RNA polymerase sigma factor (sigma-70 family)
MVESHSTALASGFESLLTARGGNSDGDTHGVYVMEALSDKAVAPETTQLEQLVRWVEAMQRGNERALEELYDATVGKLYALASVMLRCEEDAEEVVCATYAYAWANASRYDGQRAGVLSWLMMMCRSRALDMLRQRRIAKASIDIAELHDLEDAGDGPDDILCLLQQRSRVHAALSTLTPDRRHLVSLAFLQDLSHQDISAVTGLPLGTVKSRVRRALTQLREYLEAV